MSRKSTVCWRGTAVVLLRLTLTVSLFCAAVSAAQTAVSLSQIKKIYVGSLGENKGSPELREALVKRLRGVRGLQVVSTQADADAVMSGKGEIWVKGHYSTSARPSPYAQNAIYGGVLSVELKGKDAETLWSYLVTPRKLHWGTVTQDLADNLVKKFQEAVQDSAANGASH
jgi:hypothetical protein